MGDCTEALFVDVTEEFSSLLFTVTSTNGSPPPPPPSKSGLKLVCNVNIVYGNLKPEKPKGYAQKPQRNCMFLNWLLVPFQIKVKVTWIALRVLWNWLLKPNTRDIAVSPFNFQVIFSHAVAISLDTSVILPWRNKNNQKGIIFLLELAPTPPPSLHQPREANT